MFFSAVTVKTWSSVVVNIFVYLLLLIYIKIFCNRPGVAGAVLQSAS